jgi:hypothetical protein
MLVPPFYPPTMLPTTPSVLSIPAIRFCLPMMLLATLRVVLIPLVRGLPSTVRLTSCWPDTWSTSGSVKLPWTICTRPCCHPSVYSTLCVLFTPSRSASTRCMTVWAISHGAGKPPRCGGTMRTRSQSNTIVGISCSAPGGCCSSPLTKSISPTPRSGISTMLGNEFTARCTRLTGGGISRFVRLYVGNATLTVL